MTDRDFKDRFVRARRAVIEADFKHLNPEQRRAVMATQGPLLLLAGAGSGKTTVLINRIANLIKYGAASDSLEIPLGMGERELEILEREAKTPGLESAGKTGRLAALNAVEPWRIIAITFTNKAAEELKARLTSMLGASGGDVWAMTFHSACVRILRRDAESLGFTGGFTIYDDADSVALMKRLIKSFDLDEKTFPPRAVLSHISRAKDALISPSAYAEAASGSGDIRKKRIAEIYAAYARRLREANAMDFDDLIYFAVKLLLNNESVREYYQRKFKYVLVDEYQDTNNLQYILASTLAGGHENICVVGDDDQSIYKFRGATIENILSFEDKYKNARIIRLEQNYRSSGHILGAANAVIKNNRQRKGKNLWTDNGEGERPSVYIAQNEHDEAQNVASRIIDFFSKGEAWRSNAVLYRVNALSNQMEFAFKRAGIPYRIIGGTRFFDRAEIKDILAYLCVVTNPSDDQRLLRIINTPPRGIGGRTVSAAQAIAARDSESLFGILSRAGEFPELSRAGEKLTGLVLLINGLRVAREDMPLDAFYDLVLEKTGYIRMLEEKDTDENMTRAENVRELKSNILTYIKEAEDSSLQGFLDEVALYSDIDKYDKDSDAAVMMTMHSAKGLEFKNVFIVGAEEGVFPGIRSIGDPDEMEEERRLCYVAITRAKRRLFISCARQRMLFGRTTVNSISRFIEEIPLEHIDRPQVKRPPVFSGRGFSTDEKATAIANRRAHAARDEKKSVIVFSEGDAVRHSAFGNGRIVALTPMGGDSLVEIEFEGLGIKRLMLRAACSYMTMVNPEEAGGANAD